MKSYENFGIYQYHTLSNGLRIVHRYSPSDVAYFGVAVGTGSTNDDSELLGMAHFVEHTIFKGTVSRRSSNIINRMERVGGELNAYTSKEETMIYSMFPCENYTRAIELIGDLISNSIFPEGELEKEREVILDEIESYRDMPAEAIYDDFEDLFFKNQPLGHNILGNSQSLLKITSADCRSFLDQWYVPENMVVFSYGKVEFDRLCRMVERYFGHLHYRLSETFEFQPSSPIEVPVFHEVEHINSHQSHTIYGSHIPGNYSSEKYAFALLNNIIGGPGMNSKLNVELREKHGYVYTVESAVTHYKNQGVFSIYFGCDNRDVKKCLHKIRSIICAISEKPMSSIVLERAKKQFIGQLLVASDNKENEALAMGKQLLYHSVVVDSAETKRRIADVTSDQIMHAAQMLVPEVSSTLTFSATHE